MARVSPSGLKKSRTLILYNFLHVAVIRELKISELLMPALGQIQSMGQKDGNSLLVWVWGFLGGIGFFGPSDPNQWLFLELCHLFWHVVFLPTWGCPQNQHSCSIKTPKNSVKLKIPQRCLCCPLTSLPGETAISVRPFLKPWEEKYWLTARETIFV